MTAYRMGLDIGTNSIGWCVLDLVQDGDAWTPTGVRDMGVRIFPDGRNPQDGSSNAIKRRMARGARRNRDRFIERRERLLEALVKHGLLPADEAARRAMTALDPYTLRKRGLDEALSLHEFGRAIFHLNQRRGFKSNRKSDGKDDDTGAIKHGLKELNERMEARGARTVGEFLYLRREDGETIRARKQELSGAEAKERGVPKTYYEFYPGRAQMEHEFNLLWDAQAQHHPGALHQEARQELRDIIFYQRPLKAPAVGRCTFEREEERAPKALPMVQRLRIYQELNNLHIIDDRSLKGEPLTMDQRDKLLPYMTEPKAKKKGASELKFERMRKILGLGSQVTFSHESEKRTGLECDTTSALLSHGDRFGAKWYELDDDAQAEVVRDLLEQADEELLVRKLMEQYGLDRAHAEAVSATPLPDGHSRLGETATRKILAELSQDMIVYSEAVVRAGYKSHSQFARGEAMPRLPYYGEVLERHVVPDAQWEGHPEKRPELRYGKVTNPTVHIALNQLRKVVNEVIKIHGKPAQIHVEVLRDLKNSLAKKKDIQARQAENQKENDLCADMLRNQFNVRVNRENIQRLRLWRELGTEPRKCPYTGEAISPSILFTEQVEVDHVLPMSRTLDDSMANKVVSMRQANREKGNRTPFEAWGGDKERYAAMVDRAAYLPRNKAWRFADDAMEQFLKDNDFIARQLTDSQYIARLARAYLAVLFPQAEESKVVCLPGRLTGMFRHHLGFDDLLDEINPSRQESDKTKGEKNRTDHRNHSLDALVVALMDRGFLNRAAKANARSQAEGVKRLFAGFEEPWPDFRATVRDALAGIIVSHKADHGVQGELHNQTAYGINAHEDARGRAVHRAPTHALKLTSIMAIKGKNLRAQLVAYLTGEDHHTVFKHLAELDDTKKAKEQLIDWCGQDEKVIEERMHQFFRQRGIRRVKLVEEFDMIVMRDKQGKPYKGFKPDSNAYMDIFLAEDGVRWEHEMVRRYDANQRPVGNVTDNERKLIKRLFNRDMIEMEHKGVRGIYFVQRLSEKAFTFAEHYEANTDRRQRDKDDPFDFVRKSSPEILRRSKVRFLVVTPAGRIRYLSDPLDDPPRG